VKIFLDTANVNEIKEGVALGVVDGVTTNRRWPARRRSVPPARRGDLLHRAG